MTVCISLAAYFVLPKFPRTTRWLSERERELAVWRLEEDIGEDDWVESGQQTFMDGLLGLRLGIPRCGFW